MTGSFCAALPISKPKKAIRIMTIGFSKHTDFYDRVPPRTVIARSEATRAARERRQWPSSDRRQRRRQGSKKLGSHLVLRKQRAAQNLSGNPEEPSDRSGWAGACVCANNVQRKCLAPTRKSASGTKHIPERSCKIGLCEGETDCQKVNCPAGRGTDCHTSLRTGSQ